MSGLLEEQESDDDWDVMDLVYQGVVVARRKAGHGQWAGHYEIYDLNHTPPRIIRREGLKRCWPVEREILAAYLANLAPKPVSNRKSRYPWTVGGGLPETNRSKF